MAAEGEFASVLDRAASSALDELFEERCAGLALVALFVPRRAFNSCAARSLAELLAAALSVEEENHAARVSSKDGASESVSLVEAFGRRESV